VMNRVLGPYPWCRWREAGLTRRWSSSPSVSWSAMAGMTRVQNQWAPDGRCGSSVRRLMATRIEPGRERRGRVRPSGAPAPLALVGVSRLTGQKVVVAMVSGLMRDWRTNWAMVCMTAWWRSSMIP